MVDRTTDGAPNASVDPGSSSDAWESVLDSAITESGIDRNATLDELADPDASAPQPDSTELSAAPAATPRGPVTGDDGAAPGSDPASDPDPLAGAAPFTFDVDGQAKTIDGAYRIPGEGLYIPEDKVPEFQQSWTKAEQLTRQVADLTDKASTLERATAWQIRDAQGNPQTITGTRAVEAQRVTMARTFATLHTLQAALNDPAQFQSLVMPQQDADGNWYVVPNPEAIKHLERDAELAAMKAEGSARSYFATVTAPPPPPEPSVASYAMPTINALIAAHKITGLTDADLKTLAAQFEPYVQTTPQGRQVDQRFLDLIKDRATLRAEHLKAADAAQAAGKFNGGMNAGRTTARPAPTARVAPPAAPQAKVGKAEAWDNVLQSALQEIVV